MVRHLHAYVVAGILAIPACAQASPAAPCTPLANADAVLQRPGLDFLLFGEGHGSVEMPALFADLVCAASASGRAAIVGVEFTTDNQPALDRFLQARDDRQAWQALRSAPAWQARDARSTRAIADMLASVRSMRRAGRPVRLLAFDDASAGAGTSAVREARMAANLLQAHAREPDSLVLALTGRGHADRLGWTSQVPPFPSAVQSLPPARTLALTFVRAGGSVLACGDASAGGGRCGATPHAAAREAVVPRGVHLDAMRPGFDGVLSAGTAYSASTPFLDAPVDGDARGACAMPQAPSSS